MNNQIYVEKFLEHLNVVRREANLQLLNDIVRNHQLIVPWENLTKMIDYEYGVTTNKFIPPIERYLDRIIQQGAGGTCWTLSIGLYWLLKELGFEVHYVYMDSGHLCLRVNLDQAYYVDVGYCAPLFQAYPMFESFVTKNEREIFTYNVSDDGIKIIRNPGPTKTLNPNPVTLDEMKPYIDRSNNWEISPVFKDILIFGYVDGRPTSITNHVLKQYSRDKKVEIQLSDEELEYWITEKFKIAAEIYKQAREIYEMRRKFDYQVDTADSH
jgi:arylamine N-acetyltransferase